MKKGAVPQLTAAWWEQNKGSTVPKSNLAAALTAFEAASAKIKKRCRTDVMYDAVKKVDDVGKEAKATIAKCNKKLHAETIEALERYAGVIAKWRNPVGNQILAIESAVVALKELGKKIAPNLKPKVQEAKAIVKSLQDAVAEAKKGGKPDKLDGWVALADGAVASVKQKAAEIHQWRKDVNDTTMTNPNWLEYTAEMREIDQPLQGAYTEVNEGLVADATALATELKQLVKVSRGMKAAVDAKAGREAKAASDEQATAKQMAETLKTAMAGLKKVAEEEDDLLRQLDYKLKHFKAGADVLREAQRKYGADLDAMKKRRHDLVGDVTPLKAKVQGQPALQKAFDAFVAENTRLGEGAGGVEKTIRDLLRNDYEAKTRQLTSRR